MLQRTSNRPWRKFIFCIYIQCSSEQHSTHTNTESCTNYIFCKLLVYMVTIVTMCILGKKLHILGKGKSIIFWWRGSHIKFWDIAVWPIKHSDGHIINYWEITEKRNWAKIKEINEKIGIFLVATWVYPLLHPPMKFPSPYLNFRDLCIYIRITSRVMLLCNVREGCVIST